jgi:hypothetical protein
MIDEDDPNYDEYIELVETEVNTVAAIRNGEI